MNEVSEVNTKDQLKDLTTQLQSVRNECRAIEQESKKNQTDLDSFIQVKGLLEDKIDRIKELIQSAEERVKKQRDERIAIEQDIEYYEDSLEKAVRVHSIQQNVDLNIRKKLEDLFPRLEDLRDEVGAYQAVIQELSYEDDSLGGLVKKMSHEEARLQKSRYENKKRVELLKESNKKTKHKVRVLLDTNKCLKKEQENLLAVIRRLESENELITNTRTNVVVDIKELNNSIVKWKKLIFDYEVGKEKRVDDLNQLLKRQADKICALKEVQDLHQDLKLEVEKEKAEYQKVQEEFERNAAMLVQYDNLVEDTRKELKDLQSKKARLETRTAIQRKRLLKLHQQRFQQANP